MSIKAFTMMYSVALWDTTRQIGGYFPIPGQELADSWRYIRRESRTSYGSSAYFRVIGNTYYKNSDGYDSRSIPWSVDYTSGNGWRHIAEIGGTWSRSYMHKRHWENGILKEDSYDFRNREINAGTGKYREQVQYYTYNFSQGYYNVYTYSWSGWLDIPTLGEYEYQVDKTKYDQDLDQYLQIVDADFISPQLQQVYSSLYLDAASSIPQADVNLIGNIKEAVEYIRSGIEAIKDPSSAFSMLGKTFTNPKDAWLQYRYVYKTNQMDAKELEELVGRINYLSTTLQKQIQVTASTTIGDRRYGISFKIPTSSFMPQDVIDLVEMFGLRVTPSNIWDLIPYSFMVDWFADIGGKLQFLEDWRNAIDLKPKSVWFTMRRSIDNGSIYYRVPGHVPVVPPLYQSHTASGKVVTMRIADTISIFT